MYNNKVPRNSVDRNDFFYTQKINSFKFRVNRDLLS